LRIKDIKKSGLEFCDCRHLNILHVLCPSLCYQSVGILLGVN